MEQDEDDIYGTSAPIPNSSNRTNGNHVSSNQDSSTALNEANGDEEEEEEEEDDSDSDIDIITERAPGTAPDPLTQRPKPSEAVRITQDRSTSETQKPSQQRKPSTRPESTAPQAELKPGTDFPEVRVSNVDVDAEPTYEPVGKPITGVNIDADLAEQEKPWRRPGSDQSDFFNYGFDEFTWTAYCLKQGKVRGEIDAQKQEQAQFENMFGGGAMPGMPGMPGMGGVAAASGAGAAGMGGMPGMPDMNPEMMNQMMQQMMASGQDPSRMDFGTFMQQMGGPMAGFPGQGMPGMDGGGAGGPQARTQGNFGGNRGRRGRW